MEITSTINCAHGLVPCNPAVKLCGDVTHSPSAELDATATLCAGARAKLKELRDGEAGRAMDADTIKLMAELAWLAYEEGCGRLPLRPQRHTSHARGYDTKLLESCAAVFMQVLG